MWSFLIYINQYSDNWHLSPYFTEKIKINLDRSQESIKQLVLEQGKELYVAPARNSEAILARIVPPEEADEEFMKKVTYPKAVSEYGKELGK